MRETEIAAAVVAWLAREGVTTYSEVEVTPGGPRADIVGVKDGRPWIVECKRSASLAVVEQIERWRLYSDVRWIAVEFRPGKHPTSVLDGLGIGLLTVSPLGDGAGLYTSASFWPKRTREPLLADKLLAALRPEQQTFAPAGTASGKRWTPLQSTCADLTALVAREGEVSLKAAVRQLRHCWPTSAKAESELRRLLRKRQVDGVVMRKVRGRLVLSVAEETF